MQQPEFKLITPHLYILYAPEIPGTKLTFAGYFKIQAKFVGVSTDKIPPSYTLSIRVVKPFTLAACAPVWYAFRHKNNQRPDAPPVSPACFTHQRSIVFHSPFHPFPTQEPDAIRPLSLRWDVRHSATNNLTEDVKQKSIANATPFGVDTSLCIVFSGDRRSGGPRVTEKTV